MAAVCTQVTVVTAAEDGPFGTTVSAFASLSLRPGQRRRWCTGIAPTAPIPASPCARAARSPT
jgi:hypothetical protein